MTEDVLAGTQDREADPKPTLARRGLLAGVAAAAAAVLTRITVAPAKAANGGNLIIGQANSATTATTSVSTTGADALSATSDTGAGVAGNSTSNYGVHGTSTSGVGLLGTTTNGTAIFATAASGAGFQSSSQGGVGVVCLSTNSIGVYGSSSSATGVNGISSTGYGVAGTSTSNAGVYGNSTNNVGVYANSDSGTAGLMAKSVSGVGASISSSSYFGAYIASATGVGVYASSGSASSYAAHFENTSDASGQGLGVLVTGSLSVTGVKSAVVPHADGTYRRLYCMESPESWFEDFGVGQLVGGSATINLAPDFAELVRQATYFIYLTPEGDSKGLYISAKSASGFTVAEQQNGASTLPFSYRVVAKRKDVVGPRLEKVKLPKVKAPVIETKAPPAKPNIPHHPGLN